MNKLLLLLILRRKYSEGIAYALKKEVKEDTDDDIEEKKAQDIAEFIAENAPDKKLQKMLWIDIFRNLGERYNGTDTNKNEEKLTQALKIMEKSKVLKIEDVLPYITDSIKIEEFKSHISECISQYEQNINELKKESNGNKI